MRCSKVKDHNDAPSVSMKIIYNPKRSLIFETAPVKLPKVSRKLFQGVKDAWEKKKKKKLNEKVKKIET